MRRITTLPTIALAAGLMSLLVPNSANAQPIVLHFDELPAMNYWPLGPVPASARLSDQYLNKHGVRFSSKSPYVAVVNLGGNHATSGTNGIAGADADGILTYDHEHPIVARFFDPKNPAKPGTTDFVSVRIDLSGGNSKVMLTAFDIKGNRIDSCTVIERGGETLKVSGQGIHFVQVVGGRGVALDDFTFNPVKPSTPVNDEPKLDPKIPDLEPVKLEEPVPDEPKIAPKAIAQEPASVQEPEIDFAGSTLSIVALALAVAAALGVLTGAALIIGIVAYRAQKRT